MADPASDIAGLLVTGGIGVLGTSIFVGRAPDKDTFTVGILQTGGRAPNPKFTRDFLDFQIVVTGAVNDYAGAYAKADAIKKYLLGLTHTTVSTSVYFAFNMRSDIAFIGYTETNKPKFSLNFRINRDGGSEGNRISL